MAKIYLSSTYADLVEYRAAVYHALRQLGHDVRAMEDYVAADERPVQRCLQDVASCELYIGILAWRYGYIPLDGNADQKSVTELEYTKAHEMSCPRLMFMLAPDAPWLPRHMDSHTGEGDSGRRIKGFRDRVERGNLRSQFRGTSDLAQLVTTAVALWRQDLGSAGYATDLGIQRYFAGLRRHYRRLDLEGLTPPYRDDNLNIPLRSIFVEPHVRENPAPIEFPEELWDKLHRHPEDLNSWEIPRGFTINDVGLAREAFVAREVYYESPPRLIIEVLSEERNRRAVILGDPGSGKSTFVKYVILSLIDTDGDNRLRSGMPGYVPILVELRHYVSTLTRGTTDTFLGFLEHLDEAEGRGLPRRHLSEYLDSNGRAIVIFDGLDEVLDAELRDQITRQIAAFASKFTKPRILVTSRAVSYSSRFLADSGFAHFTLQDFDPTQVEEFAKRWYSVALPEHPEEARHRCDRVLAAYRDSKSIRQLAGNPMLLTILTIIGKNQELPLERWKLYDHAASVLIEHWDVIRHIRRAKPELQLDGLLGEEDKKELLRRLAQRMQNWVGPLGGIYLDRDQLEEQFRDYVEERYRLTFADATGVARSMIDLFRERNFILCRYGPRVYGFVHRAFLEFFCASAVVRQFERTRQIDLEYIKKRIYTAHWEDPTWHEIHRLIVGMLDERFASHILDHMMAVYRPWPDNFSKRPPWNIALAVACLGEINNLNAVRRSAARLLKKVCHLFTYGMRGQIELQGFLRDNVMPGVDSIGPRWPGREYLVRWLRYRGRESRDWAWFFSELLGEFLGSVAAGLDDVHEGLCLMARHADQDQRVLVPFALARGWKQGSTRSLLYEMSDDVDARVRSIVGSAIAKYYPEDSDSFALVGKMAGDGSHSVRAVGCRLLAKHYAGGPSVFELITDLACLDPHETVRRAAVQVLAQHFAENSRTDAILTRVGETDKHFGVRAEALAVVERLREAARFTRNSLRNV